ncbi:unnamed protein product, partial [Mesorhabditis spiculigera]
MPRRGEGLATMMLLLGPPPGGIPGQNTGQSGQRPALRIPTTVIRRPSTVVPEDTMSQSPSSSGECASPSLHPRGPGITGSTVCLQVSSPKQQHSVRYNLPSRSRHSSRRSSWGSCEREKKAMDFDPNGAKWQCCCCNLPTGLKIMAVGEVLLSSAVAATSIACIFTSETGLTWFLGSLVFVCLFMAVGSVLLFAAIASPSNEMEVVETATLSMDERGNWQQHHRNNFDAVSESLALRLVGLVFGMLFFAVLVFYTIYLVLRCVHYVRSFARLRERRESLIQAGMIEYGSKG